MDNETSNNGNSSGDALGGTQPERIAAGASQPPVQGNGSGSEPVYPAGDQHLPAPEMPESGNAPGSHRAVKIMPSVGEPGGRALEPQGDQPVEPRAAGRPTAPNDARPRSDLRREEVVKSSHPGDRIIRYSRNVGPFKRMGGRLVAGLETEVPRGSFGRFTGRIKRVLIGRPISSEHSIHERLTNVKALAVLSSDALSSVAYATEEIIRILVLAGVAALSYALPLGLAVIVLMAVVVASYRQTIAAYPKGGGTYIVAKDNLGTLPGLTAAASIMLGYILTVSVSVAAGVAAIYSLYPNLRLYRVAIAVGVVIFVTIVNLRGLREAGNIFAVPTYLFIFGMLALIGYGLLRVILGVNGQPVYGPPVDTLVPAASALQPLGLLLLLRAFTQGSAALTGVEAIADGVPAFKPPEAKNARTTLLLMGGISIIMFGGITLLATQLRILPSESETVVSQLARTIFGKNGFWYFIQVVTALILVLAANTAFADFPRLSYFLARDKFMPHQYSFRGDKLAYSWGIVTLAVLACILIVIFDGDTSALIPLYAIGVMSAFSFSQSGMVVRWWRMRPPGWQGNLLMNAVGALTTTMVLIIAMFTKLEQGTWIFIILLPVLVALFLTINRHYMRAAKEVAESVPRHTGTFKHTFIVPVSSLNAIALNALGYARSLSPNVTAVHIAEGEDEEEEERFKKEWYEKVEDRSIDLVIIESPYRSLLGPLLHFIDTLDQQYSDDTITIVLPEVLPSRFWEYLLHNQSALRLKAALLFRPNTVVADMPYVLGRNAGVLRRSALSYIPVGPIVALLVIIAIIYFFFFPQ